MDEKQILERNEARERERIEQTGYERAAQFVSDQDDEKLGNEDTLVEEIVGKFSSPNDDVTLDSDRVRSIAKAEREKRDKAEIEEGRYNSREIFGDKEASEQFARACARYDPTETKVQAAEFYKFTDREVNDYGYI